MFPNLGIPLPTPALFPFLVDSSTQLRMHASKTPSQPSHFGRTAYRYEDSPVSPPGQHLAHTLLRPGLVMSVSPVTVCLLVPCSRRLRVEALGGSRPSMPVRALASPAWFQLGTEKVVLGGKATIGYSFSSPGSRSSADILSRSFFPSG